MRIISMDRPLCLSPTGVLPLPVPCSVCHHLPWEAHLTTSPPLCIGPEEPPHTSAALRASLATPRPLEPLLTDVTLPPSYPPQ
jgi:hypothetical protein